MALISNADVTHFPTPFVNGYAAAGRRLLPCSTFHIAQINPNVRGKRTACRSDVNPPTVARQTPPPDRKSRRVRPRPSRNGQRVHRARTKSPRTEQIQTRAESGRVVHSRIRHRE